MGRGFAVAVFVFSFAAASFAAVEGTRVAPFRLGGTDSSESSVGAFVNGTGFGAVTWRDAVMPGGPAEIRYTPVDANGHAIVSQARTLVSSPRLSAPRVSDAGNSAVLAWFDDNAVTVASLSHTGILGTPHVVGKGRTYLTLGCNASRCVVQWYDGSTSTNNAVVTDTDGNVAIGVFTTPFTSFYAASDPSGVLLAGRNQAARIDTTTGAISFTITMEKTAFIQSPDFDGKSYAFVWSSYDDGVEHIHAAKVSLSGVVSSPKVLWTGEMHVAGLLLEWNGSEHLLAFAIDDGDGLGFGQIPEWAGSANIYARRLTAALDSVGPEAKLTKNAEANRPVDLVWNGAVYYLLYGDGLTNASFGAPFSARGALISTLPGVLSRDVVAIGPLTQRTPALAASGGVRLVAWTEMDRTDNTMSLRAARLRRDGSRIDETPLEIASGKGELLSRFRGVAAAGADFLVVWLEGDYYGTPVAAIVRASGVVERIALPFGDRTSFVEVASNGSSWLVAAMGSASQATAVRISRSGQLLTPQPIALGSAVDFDLAASGDRFGVLRAPSVVAPCTQNCAPRILTILDADANAVVTDIPVANGGAVTLGGGPSGFLIFNAENRARVFDRNGNAGANVATFPYPETVVDIQPFGSWWLVWLRGMRDRLIQVDAAATSLTTAATIDVLEAFAVDEGTVTTLLSRVDELPPNGFALALVVRDLAPIVPPRRRAAGQ